jgi:hypothetical protein
MSKMPPIPKEQRSFRSERPDIEDMKAMHPDPIENPAQQGQSANTRQNLTQHRQMMDR